MKHLPASTEQRYGIELWINTWDVNQNWRLSNSNNNNNNDDDDDNNDNDNDNDNNNNNNRLMCFGKDNCFFCFSQNMTLKYINHLSLGFVMFSKIEWLMFGLQTPTLYT